MIIHTSKLVTRSHLFGRDYLCETYIPDNIIKISDLWTELEPKKQEEFFDVLNSDNPERFETAFDICGFFGDRKYSEVCIEKTLRYIKMYEFAKRIFLKSEIEEAHILYFTLDGFYFDCEENTRFLEFYSGIINNFGGFLCMSNENYFESSIVFYTKFEEKFFYFKVPLKSLLDEQGILYLKQKIGFLKKLGKVEVYKPQKPEIEKIFSKILNS